MNLKKTFPPNYQSNKTMQKIITIHTSKRLVLFTFRQTSCSKSLTNWKTILRNGVFSVYDNNKYTNTTTISNEYFCSVTWSIRYFLHRATLHIYMCRLLLSVCHTISVSFALSRPQSMHRMCIEWAHCTHIRKLVPFPKHHENYFA